MNPTKTQLKVFQERILRTRGNFEQIKLMSLLEGDDAEYRQLSSR